MKNIFTTFAILFSTLVQSATVYTTNASGTENWGNINWIATGTGSPQTWIIPSNLTAVINSNTTLGDTLRVLGILDFKSNVTLTMATSGYIEIKNGATVTGGSGNTKIIFGTTGTITGPYNGSGVYSGPSYAHNSTGNTFITGTALPVTWLAFNYDAEEIFTTLKWSTASELNNSHFEIERASQDGKFLKIGEIKGNGTTQTLSHYTFNDKFPISTSCYYRLKQVDYNGDFEYSKTLKVTRNNPINTMNVYPTLITQNQDITYTNQMSLNATFELKDNMGKTLNAINSTVHNSDGITLNLKTLKSGTYYLIVTDNNHKKAFKILIQ